MGKSKYEQLANSICDLLGGKSNVEFFTHCVTRLRFNLKDQSLVKKEEIEKLPGVLGSQWSGEQYQIIIGQSVGDAYNLICKVAGFEKAGSVDDIIDGDLTEKKPITVGNILNGILDAISGSLTPAIPVLIGCGMVKVLLIVLELFGITAENSTYQILSFVGDAGFYFLPILVGGNAAKKFGANQGLGMVMGAMLVYPTFVNEVAAGTAFTFLNIPIYGASYTSTIFPAILTVWVMSYVEKFFAKIAPDFLRSIIEPLCTLLVMVPLSFCLLAPAGAFLGNYVSAFVIWLYNLIGPVGVMVLAAFMPFFIMTGMHAAFVPYLLQMFSSNGYEPIFFTALVISNIDQGAASLAVAVKSKDKQVKSTGLSCAITAIVGGVTEPAMYGINLKYKKPMWGAMIGSAIGGLFAGLMSVYIYAFAGASALPAIPCFVGGDNPLRNVILLCVSIVIGIVSTFVATFILYKDEEVA